MALTKLYRYRGNCNWSVCAKGQMFKYISDPYYLATQSSIPVGAVIQKALLFHCRASTSSPAAGSVTFDGNVYSGADWTALDEYHIPETGGYYRAYYRDITALVAATVGAGGGSYSWAVTNESPDEDSPLDTIEGTALVIVWSHASEPVRTALVLAGAPGNSAPLLGKTSTTLYAQSQGGLTSPGADEVPPRFLMSAGVSFSFGSGGRGTQIDVTTATHRASTRLSTSCGGDDDGSPLNGALITIGTSPGVVDSALNPAPFDIMTSARVDDELYSLDYGNSQDALAFYVTAATTVTIQTYDTTGDVGGWDEHLFFLGFLAVDDIDTSPAPEPFPGFDTDCD